MAPELRKRKPKEAVISAPKPLSQAKAKVPAVKRKAADDASPVSTKKSKPTKDASRSKKAIASDDRPVKTKASKSAQSTIPTDKADSEAKDEEEEVQSSDNEQDDAQALAKVYDSDDDSEDAVTDGDVTFQEGQDVGEIPKESAKLLKSAKSEDSERGVVYVGRLPHGFYEREMRSYFSQFGDVERLRMSRNKKTGASKHFAFIEFASAPVAEVVAKTMDNYLLFGRILKVKVVPKSQINENVWKGANKRFNKIPRSKLTGNALKKPLSESTWTKKISKEEQKRSERAKKLLDMGYEFEAPKIKSIDEVERVPAELEGTDGEAPKAVEAAPEASAPVAVDVEEEQKTESNELPDSEPAVEKPAKASKQSTAKSSKKAAKKSSKAKKVAA